MTARTCIDCLDALTSSERCGPCWKRYRAQELEREPEPSSWLWCAVCGGLGGLRLVGTEWLCPPCLPAGEVGA